MACMCVHGTLGVVHAHGRHTCMMQYVCAALGCVSNSVPSSLHPNPPCCKATLLSYCPGARAEAAKAAKLW